MTLDKAAELTRERLDELGCDIISMTGARLVADELLDGMILVCIKTHTVGPLIMYLPPDFKGLAHLVQHVVKAE